MTTPINIIIDNKTVIDDVESCEIGQQEGSYCNTVSLSMKSKTFWTLCDPTTNFGTLRIKVVIGATTYQFLTEERDTTPTKSGVAFTVWGRSKQALLSTPYSKSIIDTDDTTHPWQTGNSTASAIVAYVIANYCSYSVTVTWNAGNFAVYEDSFSVSNQAPVDVIAALANVIGAELVAAADGSLSVEAYSVAEGASVESYNDLDDIVQLGESIDYPSGFNAVTVYGYDSSGGGDGGGGGGGGGGVQAYISAGRTGSGSIYPGRNHTVRVYYYHSKGSSLQFSFETGVSCQETGSGSESITEDVQLIFGQGNTSKPNTKGVTSVTGTESTPIATRSVSYNTNYKDYAIRGAAVGDYEVMFYFADKSAYTIYSFSVVSDDGDDDDGGDGGPGSGSDLCGSIVVEKESPETVSRLTPVYVRSYGEYMPVDLFSSGGYTPDHLGESNETKTEDIVFVNGSATLSYPMLSSRVGASTSLRVTFAGQYLGSLPVKYWKGSNKLVIESLVDTDNIRYYSCPAKVEYSTSYFEYRVLAPSTYNNEAFEVLFQYATCGIKTLSLTVSNPSDAGGEDTGVVLYRDITVNIKDYVSSVDLSGAAVYIDGASKGSTDANGLLNVSNVSVGDHTIRITKSGYQSSDLDDLANDTFTVSAS